MAIKYTEEQLNTVDKSIIIQMFLNQQEELSKAVNQIEQLTKEVQSGNDKLPAHDGTDNSFQQCPLRTFFRKDG